MKNSLVTLFFAVSILVAAISAFLIIQDRKQISLSMSRKAQSEADAAEAVRRTAEATQRAEEAKLRQVTEEKERQLAAVKASEAAEREAKSQKDLEETRRKTAEAQREIEVEKANAAADARAQAEATVQAAKLAKEKAVHDAKKAESEAAKAEDLRIKSESETLRMRYSLAEVEQMKNEYASLIEEVKAQSEELEEMKRALTPEKTIKDLVIVGADSGSSTNETAVGVASLRTPADRKIARLTNDRIAFLADTLRRRRVETLNILEKLLDAAVAEKRIVDADFYFNTIKSLYPDWTYNKKTEVMK